MATRTEMINIEQRNLRATIHAEKISNKPFDQGYYKGKTDAIAHILELLEEEK